MSEQDDQLAAAVKPPTSSNPQEWMAYWNARGQPWRTEPEIDIERQNYLAGRRTIVPDIELGKYPFRDIELTRADIEWLLATHEHGRGPVDWSDTSQREREAWISVALICGLSI